MTVLSSSSRLGDLVAATRAAFSDAARRASEETDLASLAAFRFLWGAVLCVGSLRFVQNGWVDVQYVEPSYFFKYSGFEWVVVPDGPWLYALFFATAACALGVAVGALYRVSALGFAAGFTYIQLLDVTNYLNHYYLVIVVAWWLVLAPAHRVFSVDAWWARRRGRPLPETGARAWLWLFRAQLAVVYVMAALAKVHPDWLFFGQPLGIWLRARTELPVFGGLFALPGVALFMSWAGFLYDLTIVGWLSWKRTRPYAFVVVLCFHGMTHLLFDIGLFPFLMTVGATLFFSSSWPRRLVRARPSGAAGLRPPPRGLLVAMALYLVVQVVVPLRHYAIPGDVLWTEEGMRFSWKVMVREKNGSVTYHVHDKDSGREWLVSPHDYLTPRQANEMSAQPDLIVQLARHIGDDFARRGHDVEVRAEAWASLNGRRRAVLTDPDVDLLSVDADATPAPWITRRPDTRPLEMR